MSATSPTNSDNVIDSRDIIKRIKELESERTDLQDRVEELKAQELEESAKPGGGDSDTLESLAEELDLARTELSEWETSDEAQELKVLQALESECLRLELWLEARFRLIELCWTLVSFVCFTEPSAS